MNNERQTGLMEMSISFIANRGVSRNGTRQSSASRPNAPCPWHYRTSNSQPLLGKIGIDMKDDAYRDINDLYLSMVSPEEVSAKDIHDPVMSDWIVNTLPDQ